MKNLWGLPNDQFLIEFIKSESQNKSSNNKFEFSEIQARSILEIRLSKLTNLERSKLIDDLKECVKLIQEYLSILSSQN